MKGMVFTEFLEMVENKFGYEMVDDLLETTDLPSGGSYTAVGTYDHSEIVKLVVNLSEKSGIEIPILLHTFGKYLFGQFAKGYKHFFAQSKNSFDFLGGIENYIHVEVRKLYPDAELPRFEIKRVSDSELSMVYFSDRAMSDFAHGLIDGCGEHYGESLTINRTFINENGSEVHFQIQR
jgi:hypothetical protein